MVDDSATFLSEGIWPFGDPPIEMGVQDGVVWAIKKGVSGLCGYAMIPAEGHPWSVELPGGASSDADAQHSMEWLKRHGELRKQGLSWDEVFRKLCEELPNDKYEHGDMDNYLSVHGGVTYYQFPWVGFDCAHAGDIWAPPWRNEGMYEMEQKWGLPRRPRPYDRHWTIEKIIEETKNLARQVATVSQDMASHVDSKE